MMKRRAATLLVLALCAGPLVVFGSIAYAKTDDVKTGCLIAARADSTKDVRAAAAYLSDVKDKSAQRAGDKLFDNPRDGSALKIIAVYCKDHYKGNGTIRHATFVVPRATRRTTTTITVPPTTTTRPAPDPALTEFLYKSNTRDIPYDELVKDPNALVGQGIHRTAQVFQYDSRTGPDHLLVAVTVVNPGQYEFWNDNVLLTLSVSALGNGIDNKDIVEFWGTVAGSYSYSTAIGGTNTVPEVDVSYLNLVEKRES